MIRLAAIHGMLAWVTFGLVEHLAVAVLPALRESSFLMLPSGRLTAWLGTLLLYAALGAVAGLLSGVALSAARARLRRPRDPERTAGDAAVLVLAGLWLLHLSDSRWLSRSVYLAIAVAFAVIAALAFRQFSRSRATLAATSWLAAPLGAALCLLCPLAWRNELHITWLTERVGASAPWLKAAVSGGGTAMLVLLLVAVPLTFSLRRGARPPRPPASPRWRGRAVAVAALFAATMALAWWADGRALGRLRRDEHPAAAAKAVPGVLLISFDAVRADHLSVYGYPHPTSPSLSRLAAHATVYRNALAASDMSLGTHASLFTGKYPGRHGAWEASDFPAGRPLARSQTTMAERLAEAGYAGIGAAANGYFLNSAYGLTRGFDIFDVQPRDRLEFRFRLGSLLGRLGGFPEAVHRRAADVNAVLRRGIEAASEGGRPFLAFANYMEAHTPYAPDEPFEKLFPGYDATMPRRERFIEAEGSRAVFGERRRRHLVSQYDAAIASVDRELGVLFDDLRGLGLYENLLIIVLADHGEMLGEHDGVFGHGAGLVEEVLRVPLIVKYPKQRVGRSVDVPVSQVDVLPTVLDVLGLPADLSLDGTSMRRAEALPPRTLIAESPPSVAVYGGSLKLLLDVDGRRAAYDLAGDRGRQLPADHPGAVQLNRVLDSWLARRAAEPADLPDPETRDRLKSLGYVR